MGIRTACNLTSFWGGHLSVGSPVTASCELSEAWAANITWNKPNRMCNINSNTWLYTASLTGQSWCLSLSDQVHYQQSVHSCIHAGFVYFWRFEIQGNSKLFRAFWTRHSRLILTITNIKDIHNFTLLHIMTMTTFNVTLQYAKKLFLYIGFPDASNETALSLRLLTSHSTMAVTHHASWAQTNSNWSENSIFFQNYLLSY